MACRPYGAKSLPKAMLTYGQLDINMTKEQSQNLNQRIFSFLKCIWRCHLQNGSHFVQASMEYVTWCAWQMEGMLLLTSFATDSRNILRDRCASLVLPICGKGKWAKVTAPNYFITSEFWVPCNVQIIERRISTHWSLGDFNKVLIKWFSSSF